MAEVLDQSQLLDDNNAISYGNFYVAQSFKAGVTGDLSKVVLKVRKNGSPGDLIVEIRNAVLQSGQYVPGSTVHATETISASTISSVSFNDIAIVFSTPYTQTLDDYYCVVTHNTGTSSNYYWVRKYLAADNYANGTLSDSSNAGSSWTIRTNQDLYFKTYVESYTTYTDSYNIISNLHSTISNAYSLIANLITHGTFILVSNLTKSFSNTYQIISNLIKTTANNYFLVAKLVGTVTGTYELTANLLGYVFTEVSTIIRFLFNDAKSSVKILEAYLSDGNFVSSLNVNINLNVSNAVDMRFQNDVNTGSWSSWESYSSIKQWALSSGVGTKKIYCQFRDESSEVSRDDFYITVEFNDSSFSFPTILCYDEEDGSSISDSTYQTDDTPYLKWNIPSYSNIPILGYSYGIDEDPDDTIDIPSDYRVLSGFVVTPAGGMNIDISTGQYNYNYNINSIASMTNITLDASHVTLNRIDRVYIDGTTGEVEIMKGNEAASPIAPTLSYGSILVAQITVNAGITVITSGMITDERENYGELNIVTPLDEGQHELKIKAKGRNGLWSSIGIFNLYVSSKSPDIGAISCYVTSSKIIEIQDGEYQTATQVPYFEWSAPVAPGTMTYYYTIDGAEPDSGSTNTSNNYIALDLTGNRSTLLTIKAKDQYDTWGQSRTFRFIYSPVTEGGSIDISQDVVVIGGGVTLRQSQKTVQVHSVSYDLRSARMCTFEEIKEFDANNSFSYNQVVSVMYEGTTIFTGKIKSIQRSIDMSRETILYTASGPRAELAEHYLDKYNNEFKQNSVVIKWEDVTPAQIINDIATLAPKIIKSVTSTPIGPEMTLEVTAVTADQAIQTVMEKTGHYGYYITPQGALVTVDLNASSPSNVYFGIKGTSVVGSNYDVLSADLDFDATQIYNKCVIEGSRKLKETWVAAHVIDDSEPNQKRFRLNILRPVRKILDWRIKGKVLLRWFGWPGWIFYPMKWVEFEGKTAKYSERVSIMYVPEGIDGVYDSPWYMPYKLNTWEEDVTISLGPDNTCHSNIVLANNWTNSDLGTLKSLGFSSEIHVKVLYESSPLRVEKVVASDLTEEKVLRVYDTQFRYDESENIDDTDDMLDYAENLLETRSRIKVKGTITLKDVYPSWLLSKTVNLQNTAQASWSSINIPVSGVTLDIDSHTTKIELSDESLL